MQVSILSSLCLLPVMARVGVLVHGWGANRALLLVDLGTLLAKAVVQAERSVRMTVVGIGVLVLGALLVFGAIYCRTNMEKIDAWLGRWREKFGAWE